MTRLGTPPSEWLVDWADTFYLAQQGRLSRLAKGKQTEGYNIGEAPGAAHLNYVCNRAGNWARLVGKASAARFAFRNQEYTTTSTGPATTTDNMHIDYFGSANKWYASGIDTSGGVFCNDSDDGITWSLTATPATVGAGATGDVSKVATDGTVCAIAADNGTQAVVYTSSDLTVANLDAGTTIDSATNSVESSDLSYDADNGLWIWVGRSTTAARVYTATDPTGTWTNRTLPSVTATDVFSLATDDRGRSWLGTSTVTESYYSTNGTTWTLSTTDPALANNVVWSEALQLFVLLENSDGTMWTSDDGGVTWRDQDAVNSVPKFRAMVHCEDFVIGWTTATVSANGLDFHDVYAFSSNAVDDDSFNYIMLGQTWEDARTFNNRQEAVYSSGQGKMIFPYLDAAATNDTYLQISRYGAPDAY